MKKAAVALIVATQLLAPLAPASAAMGFDSPEQTRMGAFAGARFRLALGGADRGRAKLGLTLAPTRQTLAADGRRLLRFGEGIELGFVNGEPFAARLGGQRLADAGASADTRERRMGVSTIGAAGIAAGAIVAGLVIYALAVRGDPD